MSTNLGRPDTAWSQAGHDFFSARVSLAIVGTPVVEQLAVGEGRARG